MKCSVLPNSYSVFFFFFNRHEQITQNNQYNIQKQKNKPIRLLNVGTRKLMDAGIIFISSKERKTLLW